jgi:hypothetical protein
MFKVVGRSAPSGRAELLEWYNIVGCAGYESLEQLSDGVLYVQTLEMCLPDAPAFLQRLHFDCCDDGSRANAGLNRERRERNLGVLQEVARAHFAKNKSIAIDTPRLAEGKLQDHIKLAKWVYSAFVGVAKSTPKPGRPRMRLTSDPEGRRIEAASELSAAGTTRPLARQLMLPFDHPTRGVREECARELAALSNPGAGGATTATPSALPNVASNAPKHLGTDQHVPLYDPRQYMSFDDDNPYLDAASPDEQRMSSADIDALLHALQTKLVMKARRAQALQQHLSQFVEMRDGLLYVTDHLLHEAQNTLEGEHSHATREDRAVATYTAGILAADPDADVSTGRAAADAAAQRDRPDCTVYAVLAAATSPA